MIFVCFVHRYMKNEKEWKTSKLKKGEEEKKIVPASHLSTYNKNEVSVATIITERARIVVQARQADWYGTP